MTVPSLDAAIDHAFRPAADAVAAGRLPGAVLGAVRRDGARAVRLAGAAARQPEPRALTRDTWFDLASLTKVLLTTRAVLRLVEDGLTDLTDPIAALLPDLQQVPGTAPLRQVPLGAFLTHTAGLPAWAPVYTMAADPRAARAAVLQTDWPLGAPCYSDLGFILLGLAVARVRAAPLSALVDRPGLTAEPPPEASAATEDCPWRGRILSGTVHDENAAALGGLAGHAGLFGTIDGVLDAAQAVLDRTWLSGAALDVMVRPHTATRALGWQIRHDRPQGAEPPWTGGSLCSARTIGHTGFTGTGLWIDPDLGIGWALLTNRVHPTRHVDTGIQPVRQAVGNRLCAALTGAAPGPVANDRENATV